MKNIEDEKFVRTRLARDWFSSPLLVMKVVAFRICIFSPTGCGSTPV